MRGAWTIIETKCPHIFANGCPAHVLNLRIQDLCKLGNNEEVLLKATNVVRSLSKAELLWRPTSGTYSNRIHTRDSCLYCFQRNGTLNTNVCTI